MVAVRQACRSQAQRVVLVGALLSVAALGAGCASARSTGPAPATTHPAGHPLAALTPAETTAEPGNASRFVLHNGDTATAVGQVLAQPGRPTRFCAPVAVAAVGTVGGGAASDCPVAVQLRGVDLTKLSGRQQHDGVVSGAAQLTGTYRNGVLYVTGQRAAKTAVPPQHHDHSPCPAPPGGWGQGQPSMTAASRYRTAHPHTIAMLAYLDPRGQQSLVYVLTDGPAAPVRTALEPTYGKKLCVARSDFTGAQIAAARAALVSRMPSRLTSSLTSLTEAGGVGLGEDEQPVTDASVPVMSASLAEVVDRQRPGLVRVDVWLVPRH